MTDFKEARVYADGAWRTIGAEHDLVTELHTAQDVAQWQVPGTIDTGVLGWLTATNDPTGASLLRTDDSAYIDLAGITFGADSGLTRHAANNLGPLAGDSLRSSNYVSGLTGWYVGDTYAEFANAFIRGELHATVFVKDLISAHAGMLVISKSAGNLAANCTIAATGTIVIETPPTGGWAFDTNDIVRIKAEYSGGVGDTWLTVTRSTPDNTYTYAYNSGTTGIIYPAGTAVVDYGVSGQGSVVLNAGAAGTAVGPYVDVRTHAGAPWTTETLNARFGNLNGSYGYSDAVTGIALGKYTAADYITIDPTLGIRFLDSGGVVRAQLLSSAWTIGNAAAQHVAISSSEVRIKNSSTVTRVLIDANGLKMYSGSVEVIDIGTTGNVVFGSDAAGDANMFYDNAAGQLKFRAGTGTPQAYVDTDGSIRAGAGVVVLDANGISITGGTAATNRIKFFLSTEEIAYLIGRQESSGALGYHRAELNIGGDTSSYNSKIVLTASARTAGDYAILSLFGLDGGNSYANLTLDTVDSYSFYVDHLQLEGTRDLRVGGGLYVGGAIDPDENDIHFEGNLKSMKNSTYYDVYGFVPLDAPLTSTEWDGDPYSTTSKTLIDLSVKFGAPAGIRAVLMRTAIRDSGSAANECVLFLAPNNTSLSGLATDCTGLPNDTYKRDTMIVPCTGGDIYYQIAASGTGTMDVSLQIWGYFI